MRRILRGLVIPVVLLVLWEVLSRPSGLAVLEILQASRSDPELAELVTPMQASSCRISARSLALTWLFSAASTRALPEPAKALAMKSFTSDCCSLSCACTGA